MSLLSPTKISNQTRSSGFASHRMAGIFLFVSVFTVNNVQADVLPKLKSDDIRHQVFKSKKDPELVAFYKQLFGEEEPIKKTPTSAKRKKSNQKPKKTTATKLFIAEPRPVQMVVPKKKGLSTAIRLQYLIDDLNKSDRTITNSRNKIPKRTLVVKQKGKQKDADLVAFYEQVFGKIKKNKSINKQPNLRKLKKATRSKKHHRKTFKHPSSKRNIAVKEVVENTTENKLQGLIDGISQAPQSSQNNKTDTHRKVRNGVAKASTGAHQKKIIAKPITMENTSNVETPNIDKHHNTKEKELQSLIDDVGNNVNKTSTQVFPSTSQKVDTPTASSQTIKKDKTSRKSNKATDLNALFAKAFGKKTVISAPSQVSVELKINKNVLGDISIYSNKQGVFDRADTKELFKLLEKILKEHVFKRIETNSPSTKKIALNALEKLGIKAIYNPSEISLDLDIKPELRKPLVLSMQSERAPSVRDENKITADKISAYLNTYSNVDLTSGNSKPQLKMKIESSLNINNFVLESTTNVRGGKFSSDKAVLTYDNPDKLLRFNVGNVFTGNRNFQENLRLDGFRVSKEFFLDPELQIRPKASESFILETDSEVEVYINNLLRQRFYLKAGIYSLEDIGLYDGANDIRVRIKDEFGKVTVKTSQQYFDSHLLKKDLSMYSITVGYLNNKQSGVNNDLITDPVLSAYYQKGLKKNLTMSLDTQLSQNSYLLGSEIITSIPLGSFKNSWAISGGKNKDSGFATRFEFRPNRHPEKIGLDILRRDMLALDNSIGGVFKNWTLSGEFRSKGFSLLNGSDRFDLEKNENKKQLRARLQTNFSLNISDNWRGVLNLGVADFYNANNNFSAHLTATRRFNNGISLSLGARYDSDDDYSVNLQLSIPLFREKGKRKKSLDLLADSKNNSLETRLNLKPSSLVGKNSLGGSLEYVQDDTSRQQNLDISYRNPSFESKLTARNRLTKNNNETSQQLSIGFNSSLACVGGRCATSFPIEDSFALVSGPSNQTTPIAINEGINQFKYSDDNNSSLPDNYTALIKSKKSNAVVRLESYRFQSINIDESTLPDGYDAEKTEFEVFPRYHQGFSIKAGGEPATILNGVLRDDENKILGYKGGQWVPENNNSKAIAFFSNKAGRFRVTSIPTGKYKLELFDYPDMHPIAISVPDLKGKVYDIGDLTINN